MTRAGVDLAELRRLAEAATPGPWNMSGQRSYITSYVGSTKVVQLDDPWIKNENKRADAAYIAAANPATILALLDLLQELASIPRPTVQRADDIEDLARYDDLAKRVRAALADPEGPSDPDD